MSEDNKSAMRTMAEIRNGRLIEDLTEQLGDLVEACTDTGKVGSLTLTIRVKPEAGINGTVASVTDQIKLTKPQLPKPATPFYVDGRVLLREDPKQHKLHIRSADEDETETKKEKANG